MRKIYPYVLKTVRIDMKSIVDKDNRTLQDILEEKGEIGLTKMEARVGNKKKNIDIGDLVIKPQIRTEEDNTFVKYKEISVGDSGKTICYDVLKDITIDGIHGKFLKEYSENRRVCINGKDINELTFPMEFKKDSIMAVEIYEDRCYSQFINSYLIISARDKEEIREDIHVKLTYEYWDLINNLHEYKNLNNLK